MTGYILYSREVRKNVVANNPESNFGEISRLVGNEWRSLPTNERQVYEEKAAKINEETKALLLNEECASPGPPVDQVSFILFCYYSFYVCLFCMTYYPYLPTYIPAYLMHIGLCKVIFATRQFRNLTEPFEILGHAFQFNLIFILRLLFTL